MTVRMDVSPELLAEMFQLGVRNIVDVRYDQRRRVVEFDVEAPDAPAGTRTMSPIYQRYADGTVRMLDPGWQS